MLNECKTSDDIFNVVGPQKERVETIYVEPYGKKACKNLIELLGGAINICADAGKNSCKYLGSNVLVKEAYGKIHTASDLVGKHRECTKEYRRLIQVMILLSIAAGHPETAVLLSKKLLLMNTLGDHDFAI